MIMKCENCEYYFKCLEAHEESATYEYHATNYGSDNYDPEYMCYYTVEEFEALNKVCIK